MILCKYNKADKRKKKTGKRYQIASEVQQKLSGFFYYAGKVIESHVDRFWRGYDKTAEPKQKKDDPCFCYDVCSMRDALYPTGLDTDR